MIAFPYQDTFAKSELPVPISAFLNGHESPFHRSVCLTELHTLHLHHESRKNQNVSKWRQENVFQKSSTFSQWQRRSHDCPSCSAPQPRPPIGRSGRSWLARDKISPLLIGWSQNSAVARWSRRAQGVMVCVCVREEEGGGGGRSNFCVISTVEHTPWRTAR